MRPPRNRLKREQRLARWNAAGAEGRAHKPAPVTGKNPRSAWVRSVLDPRTDFSATVRLVAAVLATYGRADGSDIWPGVRVLAAHCRLSARVVSASLDRLVRAGYVLREWKYGNAAGRGFRYILTLPVLTQDAQSVLTQGSHVLTQGSQLPELCTDGSHGVNPGARGVNPGALQCEPSVHLTSSSIQSINARRPADPAGQPALRTAKRAPSAPVTASAPRKRQGA